MESNSNEQTEKIDLEELISSFKVQNKEIFKSYLKDIWSDLTQRNNEKHVSGISKLMEKIGNLPSTFPICEQQVQACLLKLGIFSSGVNFKLSLLIVNELLII